MSKTWLVFEDGSYYSVDCSLHTAPKGNPKPVDAYLFTEPEGDFTIAARKASHAVFTCAEQRGLYEHKGPIIAGFDLSERIRLDTSLTGQSGGLCFAVCFAKKLLKTDPGNIAATGVIEADGKIGRVKGIEIKLKTAAHLTKEQGIILFPEENLPDISQDLKQLLKKKNIKSFPVANIDQVFDILFKKESVPPYKKSFLNKQVLFFILMLVVVTIAMTAWAYFINNKKAEVSQPTKEEKQISSIETSEKALKTNEIKKTTLEPEVIPIKQDIELTPEPNSTKPGKVSDSNPLPAENTKQLPNVSDSESTDDKGFE